MKKYVYTSLFMVLVITLILISGCSEQKNVAKEDSSNKDKSLDITLAKNSNSKDVKETDNSNIPSHLYCESDDDCLCGISVQTAECGLGNRDYIMNGSTYAPDGGICETECFGEIGQLELKCVSNMCKQI